jgi:hypothetical protein
MINSFFPKFLKIIIFFKEETLQLEVVETLKLEVFKEEIHRLESIKNNLLYLKYKQRLQKD